MVFAYAKYIQSQLICQLNFFQQIFNTLMPIHSAPRNCFRLHICKGHYA